jgi:cytochrome P450
MSIQSEAAPRALDHPLPWPQPGTGAGVGGPPFYDEQLQAWVVSAYDDVDAVMRDHRSFSSKWVAGPFRIASFSRVMERVASDPRAAGSMVYFHLPFIASDGAVHQREHAVVAKAFTPKRVRALEPTIRSLCEELLAGIAGERGADFMSRYAVPLPVQVIASALGLPTENHRDLRRWSDGFQVFIGDPDPTPEAIEEFLTASAEYTAYVEPLIEERRRDPGDDIISVLVSDNEAQWRPSVGEILSMTSTLLLAGNETSAAALSGAMLYLARLPELQEQVRAERALIPALVEEMMRLTTPPQVLFRTAVADVELAGQQIREGQHVLMRIAAANRDPARFEDPLMPRLDRADKRHVAFGRGIHTCVGAPLARAELRITLETVLEQTSWVELSDRDAPVVAAGNEMTAGIGELYLDIRA